MDICAAKTHGYLNTGGGDTRRRNGVGGNRGGVELAKNITKAFLVERIDETSMYAWKLLNRRIREATGGLFHLPLSKNEAIAFGRKAFHRTQPKRQFCRGNSNNANE